MAYTTINKSSDYFNTKLYTGNGSTQSITGVGFQPDWVWTKERSGVCDHHIFDVLRGATYKINSASTEASSADANTLTSFDSDGFSVGTNPCQNNNTDTYVSWNWKANGAGSANTDGDITSTVSASSTSGFSIVKYTGNGSSGATVGHGLGSTVKMVMCKGLGDTYGWKVFHSDLTSGKTLVLQTDAAEDVDANRIASANASTFTTSGTFSVNESGSDYVAYCFAEKTGFSKFGSYTGNGNVDGSFIYTGFKPAFILIKRSTSTAAPWCIFDNKRDGYNPNKLLLANNTNAESSPNFDIVSNGFKTRTADGEWNGSGSTYIYMAFGQSLVGSNNIPATAR